MTGWEIVGACVIALPFLVIIGGMAALDPVACALGVLVTVVVVGVITVGSLLLTGAWTP